MGSTAQRERATSRLADLPTELELKVLDYLDDPSLCTLGVTSKYFNNTVFPHFFSKHKIVSPEFGSLCDISRYGAEVVTEYIFRAVRCCLKAKYITVMSIKLDGDIARLLDDISELMAIIKQTNRLQDFTLNTIKLNSWASKENATLPEGFGPAEWMRAYTGLIEAVIEKQCTKITFFGGEFFLAFLEEQYQVNPNVVPTQSHGGEALNVAVCAPPAGKKSLAPSRLFFRRVSHLFRQHKQHSIVSPCDMKAVPSLEPKLLGKQPRSDLKTVNIQCGMLVTPHFTDWTMQFLHANAQSITHFFATSVTFTDASRWDKALATLTLPNLTNFSLSSYFVVERHDISPSTLAVFLFRHSKIRELVLQGYSNSEAPTPVMTGLKSPILPELTHVTAHPTTLQWILRSKKHWSTLKQVRPSTGCFSSIPEGFDHRLLDNVLKTLVSHKAIRADLSLGFQFSVDVEGPLDDWLQSHVDARSSSLLSRFTGTKKLEIRTTYCVKLLCPERIELFAQWVALFPNVEELCLQDHPIPWPMDNSQIVSYLRRYCPRVRKLDINRMTDIDVHAFQEPVSM